MHRPMKVTLKPTHAKKLTADSRRTKKGADELLALILGDFFRGWRSDKRWIFYQQFK
jgi:hypothetical protein